MKAFITISILILFPICSFSQTIEIKDYGNLSNLAITTLDGQSFNTNDMKNNGKPVIIICWTTWIGKLTMVLDKVNEHYEDWAKEFGIKVFSVAHDEKKYIDKIKSKVEEKKLKFQNLFDPEFLLLKKLNFEEGLPALFITDGNNNVKWIKYGYSEGDELLYPDVIRKISETTK